MRKLVIALTASAAIGAVGMPLWQAHAANLGDGGIKLAIKNYTPITKAACGVWGPYCPPGRNARLRALALLVCTLLAINRSVEPL
jgi:hypothetical protein